MILTGCAPKKPMVGPIYVIESSDKCQVHAEITGCNLKTEPPTECKKTKVTYTRGCGQIKVND